MTEAQILDIKETSAMTHTSEATLRYWRHRGDGGPKSFKIGRRVMYKRLDVERWLEEQYNQPLRA